MAAALVDAESLLQIVDGLGEVARKLVCLFVRTCVCVCVCVCVSVCD